jgi:glyoxylase-like metal-dependent hydrolase (beta-lactamase superfamily II)
MHWQLVTKGVWHFQDSCNVYAVEGPQGTIVIDAGTGGWLDHVDALPAPPVAVLLTHYFRDHTAGAVRAARSGLAVYVPEYDRDILTDPQQHFRERDTYVIYDNLWDLFAPIEPLEIAGVVPDYGTISIGGLDIEAIPLPGVTLSQTGYGITIHGEQVVFCGESIHSPGKLPRIAPLQYNYNDLPGATNCYYSAQVLRNHKPAALFPSLGEPILDGVDQALVALQDNLRYMTEWRTETTQQIEAVHNDTLVRITDHVWRSANGNAHAHFLISESGKALAIDYGYCWASNAFQAYSKPARRRALLHGLEDLKRRFDIDQIDVVLVSHFHDDHVAGIPLLQRLFGTECWAGENFADLLSHPEAHCFPCNWPKSIRVDRRLSLDQVAHWEEYTFELAPMSGHTRFANLIGFEADGKRFAHTGDQYMYLVDENGFYDRPDRHNYVFRNGSLLDGYQQSSNWLLKWRPDIVLSGHWATTHTNEKFFQYIENYTNYYRQMHERAMPLGVDEPHFNIDSWGGWIWPYRTHLTELGKVAVTVTARNPYARAAKLDVRLVGPTGWKGTSASLDANARADVSCELSITPNGLCRRQPFALELTADGRPFGQVAEALITVGGRQF